MTYDQIAREIDELFRTLQSIIIAALVYFGAFIVAAVPAVFTGMGVASLFADVTIHSALIGWLVGIALEVVNIIVIHTASEFYTDKPTGRFWILVWLIPVYVIGVELVMIYSDNAFPPLVKSLGMVSPFFAIAVFIAAMFNQWHKATRLESRELEEAETAQQLERERFELEHKHELERLELEYRHSEKLAKIEAKKDTNLPRNKSTRKLSRKRFSKIEKRQISLDIIRERPKISGAELGRQLGASDRTGQSILNELEQAGAISRNGEGWKVIL